ncbi:MAG: hypothetical protein L0Z70_09005 [Chloroflexi bacterium]|nr:hypothetical protein [Chloroflexota bacterium]
MLANVTHILPLTIIRRERLLPVAGKVSVRRGQKVNAMDTIAEARLAPEHLALNIARGLGLPEEEADRKLQVKAGQQVAQGDLLAGPVGVMKRVVRAPRNGRVVLAGGGQILMEVESAPYELKAGIPGMVVGLVDERGVVIECSGALIQGVWGNGGMDYGLMHVLLRSADDELTNDRLDVSMRGSIVLGGYCGDPEVIKTAASLPVRGMILASIEAEAIPVAVKARFPIMVVEGFGRLAMNSAAYNLLTTNERREVALNAQAWDQFNGNRPEAVIQLPASGDLNLAADTAVFAVGKKVHALCNPQRGKIGSVTALLPGVTRFPSGLAAPAAEVQLEDGEKVILPLASLEILE